MVALPVTIQNKWFNEGLLAINDAKTSKEAQQILIVWLDKAKTNRNMLWVVTNAVLPTGQNIEDISMD